jgi:hypothetical protein
MPNLIDHSPFSDKPSEIAIQGKRVRLRANQIIVWVSLSLHRLTIANPEVSPFPAILDTGHNHTFSIHERHLTEWAGLRMEILNVMTAIRHRGQRLLLRAANVWVHPNERGARDKLADRPPYLLKALTGIAVYPGSDFPRLPILGLRAIAENNLVLKVDGPRRQTTLRTQYRWWPFL